MGYSVQLYYFNFLRFYPLLYMSVAVLLCTTKPNQVWSNIKNVWLFSIIWYGYLLVILNIISNKIKMFTAGWMICLFIDYFKRDTLRGQLWIKHYIEVCCAVKINSFTGIDFISHCKRYSTVSSLASCSTYKWLVTVDTGDKIIDKCPTIADLYMLYI